MKVVILDSGCANLLSVRYAIAGLGYQPIISFKEKDIWNADKLVLPGVGSASSVMQKLSEYNLVNLIKKLHQPVLGICLGMQILASQSAEGNVETLAIIDDTIKPIPNLGLPLPHMGWNRVTYDAYHPLFKNIQQQTYFYFVHSYALPLCLSSIASTHYGTELTAAMQKDNFYGVQFHPERSGIAGKQLLKNFLEM